MKSTHISLMNRIVTLTATLVFMMAFIFMPVVSQLAYADSPLSDDEIKALADNPNWVADHGECGEGPTNLSGNDNEEKTWNYFKSKGLTDKQVAGIMGNMLQESHFDPQIIQGGGDSKNPSDAGGGGWGLIQWTPGSKIVGMAKTAGVSGPIYELSTQLDLVWQHMKNNPVVTKPFDMSHFKSITNEQEAAAYFGSQIEGFGVAGARIQDATDILKKYGGKSTGSTGSGDSDSEQTACGAASASTSPECKTASGNEKILCEAKKYDPVNYVWGGGHGGGAAYHKACTSIKPGETCGLDCSGLVSVAVYDAFSYDKAWTTDSLRADTSNWKEVQFSQLQAGDVIEPDPGHVEIVDHVQGSTVYTFGAHTSHRAQPQQVGPAQFPNSGANQYFRYIGPGGNK